MAVMSMLWWIISLIAIAIVLSVIVCIVNLWRKYRKERRRNRKPTKVPLPVENRRSTEEVENEEINRTIHTEGGDSIYANVSSPKRTSEDIQYENFSFGYIERFPKRTNGSQPSDMNPLLSQSQPEVTVTESVNKCNVPKNFNTIGTTSQKNIRDPTAYTADYNFKVSTPVQNIPNVASSRVVTSKTNLADISKPGTETIRSSRGNDGKNMPTTLRNKPTKFVPRHNSILKISWDFQNDKITSSVNPESQPGDGRWRSRANSLPSKVIIDKNKLSPSLHQKITLELSTGSNPDVLYDVPRRTTLSSEHKRRFKSANNWNQSDASSSKSVAYENVTIRTDWSKQFNENPTMII